jgi:hypothetical protein
MGQNNGTRPKLVLEPGEEALVTLIRDNPVVGRSDFGPYFCYSVLTADNTEMSLFATEAIHSVIQEKKLRKGSKFILRKPIQTNGKKAAMEIALVAKEQAVPQDDLKTLLLQSIRDAADIVKEAGVQFSNEELQRLSVTLFLQRVRA